MYKIIQIDLQSKTHIIESLTKPDKTQVSFFSGSYHNPIPVIFLKDEDKHKWTNWINNCKLQTIIFSKYYYNN